MGRARLSRRLVGPIHFIPRVRRLRQQYTMRPRYIAARRPSGLPNRHLTARRLERMRSRFHRATAFAALALAGGAYLVW